MKMPWLTGNLGLKILALVLAIVLYHALKSESSSTGYTHDQRTFQYR